METISFFRAIQNGNAERVRSYLQNGLNPNRFRGVTPLSLAVKYERLEIVHILIEYLADPNVRDSDGVTCISLSKSSHGMSEFAELLLKYGADPTIRDKHGKTYLM
nr:ankyrin repeat domain-containing protein [Leptospira santarosai]